MGHYVTIEVESFFEGGQVRVRPCTGGQYSPTLHVACSKKMRSLYPVGTVFRIDAQLIERADADPYLFCAHTAEYEVVRRGRQQSSR